jgi:IstB-like ATP binding protein
MAEMPESDLRGMLRRLHLTGMADNFADLALKAASVHLTYEAYLAEVVECECVLRAQRRIARLLRQSGLPAEKTFQTLQLDRFPLVIQQQVEHVRRGTFVKRQLFLPTTTIRFADWVRARGANIDEIERWPRRDLVRQLGRLGGSARPPGPRDR